MSTITSTGYARDARYPATAYASRDIAALIGRALLAAIFIWSGFGKLTGFEGLASGIAAKGLPMPTVFAALAVAMELGGGILLLIGLRARWIGLLFVIFLAVITPMYHDFWNAAADAVIGQQINFMKNVAIAGGMLMVFAFGPGRYSLDRERA
jgi:putative oxidoreductase